MNLKKKLHPVMVFVHFFNQFCSRILKIKDVLLHSFRCNWTLGPTRHSILHKKFDCNYSMVILDITHHTPMALHIAVEFYPHSSLAIWTMCQSQCTYIPCQHIIPSPLFLVDIWKSWFIVVRWWIEWTCTFVVTGNILIWLEDMEQMKSFIPKW